MSSGPHKIGLTKRSWLALKDFKKNNISLFGSKTYAQEGEDIILKRIFDERKNGFYVDIGAHHPIRFSNTCLFYKMGWNGINVDANAKSIGQFVRRRKRDINLNLGVSEQAGNLTYYIFDEPALNTFDRALATDRNQNTSYNLIDTLNVETKRLDWILDKHLPPGQVIDFLNIDVEGFDLAVLKSNDWVRYRPRCVLVESLCSNIGDILRSEMHEFLENKGYVFFAKTYNTSFYIEDAFVPEC